MRWWRKQHERKAFEIFFSFEKSHIRLDDGSLFSPEADADDRWVSEIESSYRVVPPHYRILYRTSPGYVFVQTSSCSKQRFGGQFLLVPDRPPTGRRLTELQAGEHLLRHQFKVPPDLLEVLEQNASTPEPPPAELKAAPVRPPTHWQGLCSKEFQVARHAAHEADLLKQFTAILDASVLFVQKLKGTELHHVFRLHDLAFMLQNNLYVQFRVNPEHWTWEAGQVPPALVDLLDLQCPVALSAARTQVADIRDLFQPQLSVLLCDRYKLPSEKEAPTEAELQAATHALTDRLPKIEAAIARLQSALAEAKRAAEELLGVDGLSDEQRETCLTEMAPRSRKAYVSYLHAESGLRNQDPDRDGFTDREVYDHLRIYPIEGYTLPPFDSWERYVRDGRRALGEQKNRPRGGRTGRSVRPADDVD